jgi:P2-related tail formation protein
MINLYDSNITDILPEPFLEDQNVIALGYAIRQGVRRLIEYCQNISVYAVIDNAPDNVLDMLAVELNTQYYEDTMDIETKRKLVANTLIWFMRAGTPAAVEELVAAVFGEGEVKEWFEYGDDPYYFKILTNALMTPDMNTQFSSMLNMVKNARSRIRAIEIHREIEQPFFSGVGQHSNVKPAAIIDGYSVNRNAEGIIYAIAAEQAQTRPAAILDGFSVEGEEIYGYTYSMASVASTEKQAAVLESLNDTADAISETLFSGTASSAGIQKPQAITEGLEETAEPVTQAITAGVAADKSIYKNTITE